MVEDGSDLHSVSRRDAIRLLPKALGYLGDEPGIFDKIRSVDIKRDGFLESFKFDLGNVSVDFLAVAHNPSTIFNPSYEKTIVESMSKADMVCVETLPFESQWQTSIGDAHLIDYFADSGSKLFFEHITEISKIFRKPLVCFDPVNMFNFMTDVTLGTVFPGFTSLALGVEGYEILKAKLTNTKMDAPLDRRTFLKVSTATAGMFYLGYRGPLMSQLTKFILGEDASLKAGVTYGLDDKVMIDILNYRDLTVGLGLSKFCKDYESEKKLNLTMVYGAAHFEPINEYSHNPNTMEVMVKQPVKSFYDLCGESAPRAYRYDELNSQWNKVNINTLYS